MFLIFFLFGLAVLLSIRIEIYLRHLKRAKALIHEMKDRQSAEWLTHLYIDDLVHIREILNFTLWSFSDFFPGLEKRVKW